MPRFPVPQVAKAALAMARIPAIEVARKAGYSSTFVYRVLNGYCSPPAKLQAVVAELVGQPPDALFRWERGRG